MLHGYTVELVSSPKVIQVVAAVIVEDGKIFATQRGPGMKLPGMWEFPGGKIEAGESAKTALRREIQEELECAIEIGEEVTTTEYEYDFGIVRLTSLWASLVDARPTLTEHQEARWLNSNELFSVEWAPADVPAIEIVARSLQR